MLARNCSGLFYSYAIKPGGGAEEKSLYRYLKLVISELQLNLLTKFVILRKIANNNNIVLK